MADDATSQETNFNQWIADICSSIDGTSGFAPYSTQLFRFFREIIEAGSLGSPYEAFTTVFIKKLRDDIMCRLLWLREVRDWAPITAVFSEFVALVNFGIDSGRSDITDILGCTIERQDWPLFALDNCFTLGGVCEFCARAGTVEKCMNVIKNGVTDIVFLETIYRIAVVIARMTNVIDMTDLGAGVANATLDIVKGDMRTQTGLIGSIFNRMMTESRACNMFSDEFVHPWLEVCVTLARGDIFEKRLAGLRAMSELLLSDGTTLSAYKWFDSQGKTAFLGELPSFHPELCLPLSKVMAKLAEYKLLDFESLEAIWRKHAVQHTNDLHKFFVIFTAVGCTLDSGLMPRFIDMCMNPSERSKVWFKFIGMLAVNVFSRQDGSDGVVKIREYMYKEAMSGNSFAKSELPVVVGKKLTDEEFQRYTDEFLSMTGDDEFCFRCLKEVVVGHPCDNSEVVQGLLVRVIDILDGREELASVIGLINVICITNQTKMSKEQTGLFYDRAKRCTGFASEIKSAFAKGLIDFNVLIEKLREEKEVDQSIMNIAVIIVRAVNAVSDQAPLEHIPFELEDLLWDLALKPAVHSTDACYFSIALPMILFYAQNDGIIVTDYAMIMHFMKKWNDRFHLVESKKGMLNILLAFICRIECYTDIDVFDIKRHHRQTPRLVKVAVWGNCLSQELTFSVPEETSMTVIRQKVARLASISGSSFEMWFFKDIIYDASRIKDFEKRAGSVVRINVTYARHDKVVKPQWRARDTIPSLIIESDGETVDLLMTMLRDPTYCRLAKVILGYIPTVPFVEFQIEEINRKSQYDMEKFLPVEFLQVFRYNFEALVTAFTDEMSQRFAVNGGFLYLINVLPKCESMIPQIVAFLSKEMSQETMSNLSKACFESFLPLLNDCANADGVSQFELMVEFLNRLDSVEMDDDIITSSMRQLLTSELPKVRALSSKLFVKLQVGMDTFVAMMDDVNDTASCEFYATFLEHIEKPCDKLVDLIKRVIAEGSPALPQLLNILKKLLENNWVSAADKEYFASALINRFLIVDDQDKAQELFDPAVDCLALLQNDALLDHLHRLHSVVRSYDDWDVDGTAGKVASTPHSGLTNMGATCFLNSALQQLFAIVPLRNAIIAYSGTQEFLIELRNLFIQMYLARGQPLSAEKLVGKWLDWEGEPMNPMVQQDACEFLQMLIDKLETGLSKELTQSLFNGTTSFQFEGISVEFRSERMEPFCTLTLPIAESTNMAEAFQKFQSPNFFTGDSQYDAEGIGKIDAKNFASLGTLPKCLVVQLGRFEYNYTTWQRTKIDKEFEFGAVLDVGPFTVGAPAETKYELTGVIVHVGSADFGHYTSYVRNGDNWLYFNDSAVSEATFEKVSASWYGKVMSAKSAYILFYTRADVVNENEETPVIEDSLRMMVTNENYKKNENCVFCSESYFRLARLLAMSDDVRFVEMSIRYYMDTLSYTRFVSRAYEISSLLCDRIKSSDVLKKVLLDEVSKKGFACALSACPEVMVRSGARDMVKCIDAADIPEAAIIDLFGDLDDVVQYFRLVEEKFDVLEWIVSTNDSAKRIAVEHEWAKKVTLLALVKFPRFAKSEESGLSEDRFWKAIDMSSIFTLLSRLQSPPAYVTSLTTRNYLTNVLASKTKASAFAAYIKAQPSYEGLANAIVEFCRNGTNFLGISAWIFHLYGEKAFDIVGTLGLRTNEQCLATTADFACLMCALIREHDMADLVLRAAGRWLISLIASEALMCRVITMYVVVMLAPHECFNKILPAFPRTLIAPVQLKFRKEDDAMVAAVGTLLDVMLDGLDGVTTRAIELSGTEKQLHEKYVAYHMIVMMDKFAEITKRDISQQLIDMMRKLLEGSLSYDRQVVLILKHLNRMNVAIDKDLLMSVFSRTNRCCTRMQVAMVGILRELESHIPELTPSDEHISGFLDCCVFDQTTSGDAAVPFLNRFATDRPELVLNYIKDRFDRVCNISLAAVVVILEALGEKLAVLPYLQGAISSKKSFMSTDELIRRTFACSSPVDFDVLPLVYLLNDEAIGSESRKCLWQLLVEQKLAFGGFEKTYIWKGDYSLLIDYLIAVRSESCKSLLLQATRNDIVAFAKGYEFLNDIACREMSELPFIAAVLSLNFGKETRIIVTYINDMFAVHSNEKERIVRPIVSRVLMHAQFVRELLKDECQITQEDVEPLFPLLEVVRQVLECKDVLSHTLEELRSECQASEGDSAVAELAAKLEHVK